ncbi:FliH/SctL family protein [Leifsonia sp. NPDC058248]|uniref:FliH/SctL family protein n=1 Tax=Leifsonia sp. NPDC058248 TaxID=3346402 RepID=UPI0036DCB803
MSTESVFAPFPIPVLAETAESHAAATAARSRGYASGYADGLRAAAVEQAAWVEAADAERAVEIDIAAQRVALLVNALRSAAVELRECTVPVLAEAETALVNAAFELAESVVGNALADRLAAARGAVARALDGDVRGVVGVVRLNPDDLDELGGAAGAAGVGATGADDSAVRFVADPSLGRGDAIGELPDGWLDARIGAALARAREALS